MRRLRSELNRWGRIGCGPWLSKVHHKHPHATIKKAVSGVRLTYRHMVRVERHWN